MKKIFFSLFFICLLTIPVLADYSVDSVAVTAEVSGNGQAQVSATYQLSFDTTTGQIAIPLPETQVSKVSVSDFRFSMEETDQGTDVIIKRRDGFLGTVTFLVRYTVPYRDDGDEEADAFSLGLLSSRWAKDVGSCSFQVLMPAAFDAEPEIVSGYHSLLTQSEAGLTVTETSFGGSVSSLMAYDSLSASMTLPNGYFRVRSSKLPVVAVNILTVVMLLIWLLMIIYWRTKLWFPRSPGLPRLLIPEGILPCQMPMTLDGSTCDVTAMLLEWASLGYLALSRSRQGVVLLTRTMEMRSERSAAEQRLFYSIFGNKLRVAATPGRFSRAAAQFRAASRRSLYRVIFDRSGGNPVLIQIPGRILLAVAIGHLVSQLLPDGGGFLVLAILAGVAGFFYSIYLHDAVSRYTVLQNYDLISVVCFVIMVALFPLSLLAGALPELFAGLGACLFSAVVTSVGPRRSKRGIEALSQAQGCRTVYREIAWSRLQYYQSRNTRFFEQQLPRALAMNVHLQFARRFERLPIPVPDWLDLPSRATRSAEALCRDLKPFLHQLREAFR